MKWLPLIALINCAGVATQEPKHFNHNVLRGLHMGYATQVETKGTCDFLYKYGWQEIDFDDQGFPINPFPGLIKCEFKYDRNAATGRCTTPIAPGVANLNLEVDITNTAHGYVEAVGEFAGCTYAKYTLEVLPK